MSGVRVIRTLLINSAALVATVSPGRIFIGTVPMNTVLPALSIHTVSAVSRNTLSMREAKQLTVERIQVTAYASSYPQKQAVLELVRQAIHNIYADIAGVQVRSVVPAGLGPDLDMENPKIFTRSRDYKVSFLE